MTAPGSIGRFRIAAFAVGLALVPVFSGAGSAAAAELPSAAEVVTSVNARDEGVAASRKVVMELIERSGKKRVRKTLSYRKYFGGEKRTVIFYLSPRNVKGTALLTFDYAGGDREDDQWLYLPALRKVRRISAADRGDYFLGTDLTYEDIKQETRINSEDYAQEVTGEEMVDGHRAYVLQSTPKSEKIAKELGYGRGVQWVDADIRLVRKAVFWDVQGNLLKTVLFGDVRPIQGRWTVHRIAVTNHKTGHRTVITYSDVDYRSEISDDLFTKRALRRGP